MLKMKRIAENNQIGNKVISVGYDLSEIGISFDIVFGFQIFIQFLMFFMSISLRKEDWRN